MDDEMIKLLGALAAAKTALYTFTNTPVDFDGQSRMVFRIHPRDFLQIRAIEEMVSNTLKEYESQIREQSSASDADTGYRAVLERIVDRWEREDEAKGGHGFDERRSPLAWAMYTDALDVLKWKMKR